MDQDLIKKALLLLEEEEALEAGGPGDEERLLQVRQQQEAIRLERGLEVPPPPTTKEILESLPRSQEAWPSNHHGMVMGGKAKKPRPPKKKVRIIKKATAPENMPFGKFKGQAIRSLPKWYLKWARRNLTGATQELKQAIRNALSRPRPILLNAAGQLTSLPIPGSDYTPYDGPASDVPWDE